MRHDTASQVPRSSSRGTCLDEVLVVTDTLGGVGSLASLGVEVGEERVVDAGGAGEPLRQGLNISVFLEQGRLDGTFRRVVR